MGKREDSKSAKRSKKHKHQKKSKISNADKQHTNLEKIGGVLPEATPAFENEEEIVCDGEVNDETVCIDVEIAEDDEASNLIQVAPIVTLSSPKPSTSKTTAVEAASALSKKTTPTKLNVGPMPASTPSTSNSSNSKKSKKRRDSGTSSEEERWLTAIESGKLEDVDDELKKMKDPKLMTARQRAMYERNLDKEPSPGGELLMSLPNGYREKEKPQTAEAIQKAALKSQKRKQLADEKREKDKKKTMERLLKKQESKQRSAVRNKSTKTSQPMITYRNTLEGAYIQMPPDCEFPLQVQKSREPPKVQLCGITGCGQPKVYNCSKTNLPLCSFACYRKNVQAIWQIMC